MPNVGEPIYADGLLFAQLTSDFPLATSSTTLQDVTALSVSVAANAKYFVECLFITTNVAGTTEDIKFGFTFPTGALLRGGVVGGTTAGVSSSVASDVNVQAGTITSGSTAWAFGLSTSITNQRLTFLLEVGSTAGTLQVQAAQSTSGSNASKVLAPSSILLTRVA